MKKYFIYSFALVFACTACQEKLEDKADRECREFTEKQCPVPVSEFEVVDSNVFERDTKTIHYYYSVRGEADTTAIESIAEQTRKQTLEQIVNNPSLMKYKEAGFNFRITFHSRKHPNQVLLDFNFTPEDYNRGNKK